MPGCRRVHSSYLNPPKGRRRGSQWELCEPAPLVDGWLKPVQQIASFVVQGGAGRAQPRFAFVGGLEAAGVPSRRPTPLRVWTPLRSCRCQPLVGVFQLGWI